MPERAFFNKAMSPERKNLPDERVESLAAVIVKIEPEPFRCLRERIPLDNINILSQPRKTFEKIDTLAENIAATESIINPPVVARLGREGVEGYLEVINRLWETDYKTEDLISVTEEDKEIFYVLIAGERRIRACRLLQESGCQVCQKEHGPGGCYKRHFGNLNVDVSLCVDIKPLTAFYLQASENIHMRVPPHEAAIFYRDLFLLIRQADSSYPKTQFARFMGRSVETINNALKFCELPLDIQKLVEEKRLKYGIAVELARLQREVEISEEGLMGWALLVITGGHSVKECRQMVSNHIYQLKSGQTMFELFDEETERVMRRLQMRKVVSHKNALILHASIYYLEVVYRMFLEGKLGRADSPFSEGSPRRIYMRLIRLQQLLLPHLKDFLTRKEYREAQETLREAEKITSLLESQWEVRDKSSPFIFFPKEDSPVD